MQTLVGLSLAAHFLFLIIAGGIAGISAGNDRKNYISVDLIRSSGSFNQVPTAERLRSTVRNAPKPETITRSAPPAETAMTLNPDVDEKAPAEAQESNPTPDVPFSSGANYQSMHRVSRPPVFRKRVTPEYPASERNAAREARVVVEIFISMEGAVDDVKLLKSGGSAFDAAVMQAVKASSFEPGYMDGKRVPVRMQIPYVFVLK